MRTRRLLVACGRGRAAGRVRWLRRHGRSRSPTRRRHRRSPEPAGAAVTCGDPTRSYAPGGSVAELRADAVDQIRQQRTAWSSASPPTPTCSAPATRSPGRSRASTSTWPRRSPRRSSATTTGSRAAAGDHRRRPDPAAAGRRRRHRGPQHDDQLRALGADRVLRRVLPRRPEGAGPQGPRGAGHRHRRRAGRAAGLCTRRHDQPGQHPATESPDAEVGHGGQPHRVPGQVPAAARPTRSPATTPCSPGSPPRTRTPWCREQDAVHRRALRHRRQPGQRGPGAVHQRGARADARRRVLAGQLRQVAGGRPWARGPASPGRSTAR